MLSLPFIAIFISYSAFIYYLPYLHHVTTSPLFIIYHICILFTTSPYVFVTGYLYIRHIGSPPHGSILIHVHCARSHFLFSSCLGSTP